MPLCLGGSPLTSPAVTWIPLDWGCLFDCCSCQSTKHHEGLCLSFLFFFFFLPLCVQGLAQAWNAEDA